MAERLVAVPVDEDGILRFAVRVTTIRKRSTVSVPPLLVIVYVTIHAPAFVGVPKIRRDDVLNARPGGKFVAV